MIIAVRSGFHEDIKYYPQADDVYEELDVSKTNVSHECLIWHYLLVLSQDKFLISAKGLW